MGKASLGAGTLDLLALFSCWTACWHCLASRFPSAHCLAWGVMRQAPGCVLGILPTVATLSDLRGQELGQRRHHVPRGAPGASPLPSDLLRQTASQGCPAAAKRRVPLRCSGDLRRFAGPCCQLSLQTAISLEPGKAEERSPSCPGWGKGCLPLKTVEMLS